MNALIVDWFLCLKHVMTRHWKNIRLFTVCICLTERYTTLKTIVLKAALAAEIQMAIRAIVYIVQQMEGNSILDSATIKAHQMN